MCLRSVLSVVGLWVAAVLLSACTQGPAVEVDRLLVEHAGWDTLAVDLAFRRADGPQAVPDTVEIYAFDASYDTLYQGTDRRFAIPDTRLGDEERMLVEVCGRFGSARVCEQKPVLASPKRIRGTVALTYPLDGSFSKGRYAVDVAVERKLWGPDSLWEQIPQSVYPVYLSGAPAHATRSTVRVPLQRSSGRFDLSGQEAFSEFRYQVSTRLLDEKDATVRFVVEGRLGSQTVTLADLPRTIPTKTRQTRADEVSAYVEQASVLLAERLDLAWQEDGLTVYVDAWTYDALNQIYEATLELAWTRRGFLRRVPYRMQGTLRVDEWGESGTFTFTAANRRADRVWSAQIDTTVVRLSSVADPEEVIATVSVPR